MRHLLDFKTIYAGTTHYRSGARAAEEPQEAAQSPIEAAVALLLLAGAAELVWTLL